ncbi:P1 family peptidase [Nonomuraea sp. NPDC049714]|uniref:P1 family peptidase n=1 Tax=Nonomuraea sp. NPDC049714 TaxID=3364357 RepID=UPI0037A6E249
MSGPDGPSLPGPANSLQDVAGLRVGHAQRTGDGYLTGTTVVLAPPGGMVAGVDVRGAAPGTRETELLDPRNLVERAHAIVLSGGSAYGLSAACGVMDRLADGGVGFPVEGGVVPIVPAAVIYDLGRGTRFRATPDAAFGHAAYDAATSSPDPLGQAFPGAGRGKEGGGAPGESSGVAARANEGGSALGGSIGAGTGAMAGGLAGGIGGASVVLPSGVTVAALAVVNAAGSVLDPGTGVLSGARYGLPGEFDHLGEPSAEEVAAWRPAGVTSLNTTIGVVATDLTLTKAQCGKLAGVAHDGLARAIRPAHTMVDGDTVFAVSTCALPPPQPGRTPYGSRPAAVNGPGPGGKFQDGAVRRAPWDGTAPEGVHLHDLLAAGADVFSRAVAHAVLAATGRAGAPAYLDVFPSALRRTP